MQVFSLALSLVNYVIRFFWEFAVCDCATSGFTPPQTKREPGSVPPGSATSPSHLSLWGKLLQHEGRDQVVTPGFLRRDIVGQVQLRDAPK